jgi:hypothetical protein
MSEQRTLANVLTEFLEMVAKRNGWTSSSPDSKIVTIENTGWIYFRARGVFSFECSDSVSYQVSLTLTPKSPMLFDIHSLNVHSFDSKPNSPNIKLIQGVTVLEHQGRRLAEDTTLLKPEDSSKPFLFFWGITCPANLESLFNAYDHVAELFGAEKVFQLPGRTI